jgi:hypothetical protein
LKERNYQMGTLCDSTSVEGQSIDNARDNDKLRQPSQAMVQKQFTKSIMSFKGFRQFRFVEDITTVYSFDK